MNKNYLIRIIYKVDTKIESNSKVVVLGEVAFDFELSVVKTIRFSQLTNEYDVLTYSVFCVEPDNKNHMVLFLQFWFSRLSSFWLRTRSGFRECFRELVFSILIETASFHTQICDSY